MRHKDLDRRLFEEEEIIPSTGFLGSVMNAVRHEAATPPPIPFPWKRAMPGLAVAMLALGLLFIASGPLFTRGSAAETLSLTVPSAFAAILDGAKTFRVGWITVALLLSLASVKLSLRLAVSRV